MTRDDIETMQKKAAIYFNKEVPIHVETRDKLWINGYIKEYAAEFLIVLDRYDGEVIVFFKDVEKISQFTGDLASLRKLK